MKHKFEKYGSLASPCRNCDLEYTFATDHRGWVGLKCEPRTPAERLEITNLYLAWAGRPCDSVTIGGPAWRSA